MTDHVVVDVEIQHVPGEQFSWDDTDKLGVSVACVWEYQTARMRIYGPDEIEALRERLLKADRVSGYNIFNFDFPVIWGIAKQEWIDGKRESGLIDCGSDGIKAILQPKTDDLLRRIWRAQRFDPDRWQPGMGGTKLDDVAQATLGVGKIGYGGDAPKWHQEGKIQRVANYCADDVAIERDLTDFVDRYGYVLREKRGYGTDKIVLQPWQAGSA